MGQQKRSNRGGGFSKEEAQVIHRFTLGTKEFDDKISEFQYDKGWYSITDIRGEEREQIFRSKNAPEAYAKWNVYIGRKKERITPEERKKQREGQKETRESPMKDTSARGNMIREAKTQFREQKELRENREGRENREPREHRESREIREKREPREHREGRENREPRENRERHEGGRPNHDKRRDNRRERHNNHRKEEE